MKKLVSGIFFALLVLIFATSFGLAFIHISDFPFIADIDNLDIPGRSGLSREEILLNYNAAIDFLSPFHTESFTLPTLAYSEVSVRHFDDVKDIFTALYIMGLVSAVLLAILIAKRVVTKELLRVSGIVTPIFPILIGAGIAIDFDWTFIVFHALLFEDNTWTFYPATDAIITILPAEFFMHCGIVIAAFWVFAALIQLYIGYFYKPKKLFS